MLLNCLMLYQYCLLNKDSTLIIESYPNGTYWISDNGKKGEFVKFVPGGIKNGRK